MSQLTMVTALSCSILACATGCAGDGAADSPPEIRYGEDICAECGMIISDPRFASALIQDAGDNEVEAIAFDDIGDMLNYMDKHPGGNVIKLYVHDALTEEWLDATVAHYVSSDEMETPMGHGLAAFAESADAERMARELSGNVLDWARLLAVHRAAQDD
ncbi:MAG: nitrous oxide reductase accessory protein NosL [Anaerolineae bacterium]